MITITTRGLVYSSALLISPGRQTHYKFRYIPNITPLHQKSITSPGGSGGDVPGVVM